MYYRKRMADYLIPEKESSIEIDVKKSQFIAYAAHTPGVEKAKAYIQSLKKKYPDARHHCYAYIAGAPDNSQQYGFSDDNEPSGTAGMPIFTHLRHSGIGEITVVVVRYFGGTKLGTGGLARAYGESTKQAINHLDSKIQLEMKSVILRLQFNQEADVRNQLKKASGVITNVEYKEDVTINCSLPCKTDLKLPYSVSIEDKSSI